GGLIDRGTWYTRQFVPAVKRAGLGDLHFHDLRHTFGSRLAMRGVSAQVIQQLMGHKDLQTTQRYMHLAADHLVAAVATLNSPSSSHSTSRVVETTEIRVEDRNGYTGTVDRVHKFLQQDDSGE